ncbi:hypothetical protein SKAU_G00260480 [Synaphobranchus kaupii]|uniref:Ig-like domain-containing protein n=1 Tax=Synaphobranchus kaupii TaxID=118154 RepID=A0A9Q1ISH5_SYNKA|nr:hypothetical protein SKAU_G00260480 [Synaphobranchus kaupii]
MEPGVRYRQRAETGDVRTLRATPDNVTLEIANALPSDSGTYRCTVSEWVTETNGNVKNIDTQSQELNAEVLSVDSLISVNLKGRTEQIVSLLPNGVITWWKDQRSYHIRTQGQQDKVSFILKVFRASVQEAGTYQCVVEAFLRQTRRSLKLSNELAVLVRKPDSRLSVSTGSRAALEHAVGSDVRMECSVLTVTTNTSRFAVDGGQKYSLVRPKARSYNLLLRNAGTGDSGKYHCVLEEWLQDPHGDWAPLASKSALIQLLITPQESRFSVTKGESKVTVQESEQVHLNCTLGPGSVTPTSHYSLTWFFVPASSSERMTLVRFSHDALLDYTGVNAELMKRMSFYRPALGSFSLAIHNMDAQDSGRYSCQVDEYLLDCEGEWLQRATDQSGVTSVSVRQTESNLHVAKDNSSVTMDNQQGSFVMSCNITSRSSAGSVFEVTWWRRQADGGGEPHPIFRARRDFTLEHLGRERLVLGRPRADLYTLTVPDAEPSDSGHYYCHVEEWLLSPRHTWRKIAQDTSGYLAVSFQTQAGRNFTVLKPNVDVSVQEGGDMFLYCKLGPGSVARASHYSFTWFFVPASSSERMTLLRFSHDALLDYTGVNAELMKRMSFYRPALGSFSLAIHNMDAQDSGRYSCQVDEYLLDCEGEWLQKATDQSGVTTVSVHQTESALRLQRGDDNITVSDQQGSFVISCNITSRSSAGSVFEVTWWRRQADGGGEPRLIFRARRDFTLEHLGRERLVLGRPRADLYTLTVPDAEPSDSGHYYCHVEEWLLSPRHTWRKIAQDTSGYLAVSFQTQGDGSQLEAPCASGMLPVVLSVLIVLLLLGIAVLAYKLRKAGSWSANRKSDRSLWAESNPLKPKLET